MKVVDQDLLLPLIVSRVFPRVSIMLSAVGATGAPWVWGYGGQFQSGLRSTSKTHQMRPRISACSVFQGAAITHRSAGTDKSSIVHTKNSTGQIASIKERHCVAGRWNAGVTVVKNSALYSSTPCETPVTLNVQNSSIQPFSVAPPPRRALIGCSCFDLVPDWTDLCSRGENGRGR